MQNSLLHSSPAHAFAIILFGLLSYSNSFQVPFALDDFHTIVRNPIIQDLSNYLPGAEGYEANPRRWFGYLSFALNYHAHGLSLSGYHLVNLAIHLMNGLLVYTLLLLTFRTPQLIASRLASQGPLVAAIAALLFVVHPVQTQAVTYIVQRLTSLSTLLYLCSLLCYVLARLSIHHHPLKPVSTFQASIAARWKPASLILLAAIAAVLSMSTKEIAFTLPVAIVIYELMFFRGKLKQRLLCLLPLLLTLPLIPMSLLTSSGHIADGDSGLDPLRAGTEISRFHYFLTQLRVMVSYLRLIILPTRQNLDYDYPVYSSIFSPAVLLSALLLGLLFAVATVLVLRTSSAHLSDKPTDVSHDPSLRLVAFGIFWFFLALSVESSFIPIEDLIMEHRLYLPMFGIAAALASLSVLTFQRLRTSWSLPILVLTVVLIASVLATATWQRNRIWQSNESLWRDVTNKSPNKARGWYNLGTHLSDEGRLEEAAPALARAIEINPQHADAWHNLGRVYLLAGYYQEAIPALSTALRLKPEMDNALNNLAVAFIRNQQPEEAIQVLAPNMHRFVGRPEVRLNLGVAYALSGNFAAAEQQQAILQSTDPPFSRQLAERIEWIRSQQ